MTNKTWAEDYYGSLEKLGERYRDMLQTNNHDTDFLEEFLQGVSDRMPLQKLNRWLGYIQGTVIEAGLTTVEIERDWSRPLLRPLDYTDVLNTIIDIMSSTPSIQGCQDSKEGLIYLTYSVLEQYGLAGDFQIIDLFEGLESRKQDSSIIE